MIPRIQRPFRILVPLRIRMTIWYGMLLGATLVVFGVLLYAGLTWRLHQTFDEQLDTQADIVLSAVQAAPDGVTIRFANQDLAQREVYIRLIARGGQTQQEQGQGAGAIPIDPNSFQRALNGTKTYRSVSPGSRGDPHLRILSVPVYSTDHSTVLGVLEVGLDRNDLDDTLDALALALLLIVPVATLIAVLGGYVLSAPVLRPISHITRLARQIGEHDLHARLDLTLPDDEVGRLASTFNDMLARIEQAFARQYRFTSDAAHELRTPISLLRGQVDLALARPRTAEDYVDALRAVDDDLVRLTNLTAALLSLARLDNPTPIPEVMTFDLAETIESLAATYAVALTANEIRLQLSLVPSPLVADEDLVIQVLVNLLDNAIAYTPAGGTITITCQPSASLVTLVVQDTGAGIAPPDLPHIFDRFYRPDAGRTRARGGAGLGLAICQSIVAAHGGTIAATSTVGSGTSFTITLPRTAHDSPAAAVNEPGHPASGIGARPVPGAE